MARTALSISIEAWISVIQLCILLLMIIILLRHFQNYTNNSITLWMKLLSITPILIIIPLSVIGGFLFNEAIIPSINSHFPFIDKHCKQLFILGSVVWHIIRYGRGSRRPLP